MPLAVVAPSWPCGAGSPGPWAGYRPPPALRDLPGSALTTRLTMTCSSRCWSPGTRGTRASSRISNRCDRNSPWASRKSITFRTAAFRSVRRCALDRGTLSGPGPGIIHETLHDPFDPIDGLAHVTGHLRIGPARAEAPRHMLPRAPSGFRTSWATPAASRPIPASFSTRTTWLCASSKFSAMIR